MHSGTHGSELVFHMLAITRANNLDHYTIFFGNFSIMIIENNLDYRIVYIIANDIMQVVNLDTNLWVTFILSLYFRLILEV
jgi:hypothetical protein